MSDMSDMASATSTCLALRSRAVGEACRRQRQPSADPSAAGADVHHGSGRRRQLSRSRSRVHREHDRQHRSARLRNRGCRRPPGRSRRWSRSASSSSAPAPAASSPGDMGTATRCTSRAPSPSRCRCIGAAAVFAAVVTIRPDALSGRHRDRAAGVRDGRPKRDRPAHRCPRPDDDRAHDDADGARGGLTRCRRLPARARLAGSPPFSRCSPGRSPVHCC